MIVLQAPYVFLQPDSNTPQVHFVSRSTDSTNSSPWVSGCGGYEGDIVTVRDIKDPQCNVSAAWLDITSKAPQRNICHAQSVRSPAWYFEELVRYNIWNMLKY